MKKIICALAAAFAFSALSAEAFTVANITTYIDRFMSGKGTCVKISYTSSYGSRYFYYFPKDKIIRFYYGENTEGKVDFEVNTNTNVGVNSNDVNDISLDAAGNLIITKK